MIVAKAWGTETVIANNERYCGKILNLKAGWQCSLHCHQIKDETFYLKSGVVAFELDGRKFTMTPGDTIHVPPGIYHRFAGVVDSVIIEVSTPHSDLDVFRAEQSREVACLI